MRCWRANKLTAGQILRLKLLRFGCNGLRFAPPTQGSCAVLDSRRSAQYQTLWYTFCKLEDIIYLYDNSDQLYKYIYSIYRVASELDMPMRELAK